MHCVKYEASPCLLGQLLVAATPRGLCYVGLGDSVSQIMKQLIRYLTHSNIYPGSVGISKVSSLLTGEPWDDSIKVDMRGTVFQQTVWYGIRQIPFGSTVSYSKLAESLGMSGSIRAVAMACGANPLALVVPCHRVVAADNLGGYKWGVSRKQQLLDFEQRINFNAAASNK